MSIEMMVYCSTSEPLVCKVCSKLKQTRGAAVTRRRGGTNHCNGNHMIGAVRLCKQCISRVTNVLNVQCDTETYKMSMKPLKHGIPFLAFLVLGSFMLREFSSIRYEVYNYKRKFGRSDQVDEFNELDNEKEIEDMKNLGLNEDWKNVRAPRPWEDNKEYQAMLDKLVEKKKEQKKLLQQTQA